MKRLAFAGVMLGVTLARPVAADETGTASAESEKKKPQKQDPEAPSETPEAPKATLRIVRPAGVADLEVRVDGKPVDGDEVEVTAGLHVVTASAPSRRDWKRELTVEAEVPVAVSIPRLSRVGPIDAELPAAKSSPLPPRSLAPPIDIAGGPDPEASDPTLGYVLGGVFVGLGAIGTAVAIGTGVAARNKRNEAVPFCNERDDDICRPEGLALREEGRDLALVSTVSMGFIPLAALGGWILYTAPRMWNSRTLPEVEVEAGPNGARLWVTGRF